VGNGVESPSHARPSGLVRIAVHRVTTHGQPQAGITQQRSPSAARATAVGVTEQPQNVPAKNVVHPVGRTRRINVQTRITAGVVVVITARNVHRKVQTNASQVRTTSTKGGCGENKAWVLLANAQRGWGNLVHHRPVRTPQTSEVTSATNKVNKNPPFCPVLPGGPKSTVCWGVTNQCRWWNEPSVWRSTNSAGERQAWATSLNTNERCRTKRCSAWCGIKRACSPSTCGTVRR